MNHNDIQHPLSKFLPQRTKGPMRSPARVLGWFSIGLGLAELALPGPLLRATGLSSDRTSLVRLYGIREIGVGVGLLMSRDPEPWLWARVAGDVLDIASVATAALAGDSRAQRTLPSLAMLAGVTAIDLQCAMAAAPRAARRGNRPLPDYSQRSGFPKPAAEMRGAAAKPSAGA